MTGRLKEGAWVAKGLFPWTRYCPWKGGSLLGTSRPLVGIDIGTRVITLAELNSNKDHLELRRFGVKRLKDPSVSFDKPNEVVWTLKELVAECGLTNPQVAVSLSGSAVAIKQISIPVMAQDEMEIEDYLTWEYQQHSYDLGDLYWDFQLLPFSSNTCQKSTERPLLLIAAKKEIVEGKVKLLESAGVEPMVLDVDSFALVNMYLLSEPHARSETAMLVNLGTCTISVAVVSQGEVVFSREVSTGRRGYEELVQEKLGCSDEEAEGFLFREPEGVREYSIIKDLQNSIVGEIKRTLEYVREAFPDSMVQRVYLYGVYARMWDLMVVVEHAISLRATIGDPFSGIDVPSADTDHEFFMGASPLASIAMGLATRKTGDR